MISFQLNGENQQVDVDTAKPILWVLREDLKKIGTKFGCGAGICGACTIHLDGTAIRSCVTPIQAAEGKQITTIEGLKDDLASKIKDGWNTIQVGQCGYCQTGQVMTFHSILKRTPDISADEACRQMNNICRCGTYSRMKKAIASIIEQTNDE